MEEPVRIDKWLWAVRIYKTRNQATLACKSGRVKINGDSVKASREVHPGELIEVHLSSFHKKIRVIALLSNRVSAKLVDQFMEDQTPREEYDAQKMKRMQYFEHRQKGIGRPTKRERREIDVLKKYLGI